MFPMGVQSRPRNPQRARASTSVSSWTTWSPMALNPRCWFDASDTTSITSSSNKVSQWNDKSGWARDMTQATAAKQPTTGLVTQNGLNTVGFDNSSQWISSSSFMIAAAGRPAWLLAVVVSMSSGQTPAINGPSGQATGANEYQMVSWSASSYKWAAWRSSASYLSTTATAAASTAYIQTVLFNGSASFMRINGVQVDSGTNGTAQVNGVMMGRNNNPAYYGGQVCEYVGLDGPLTSSAIAAWEQYAATKWGVAIY